MRGVVASTNLERPAQAISDWLVQQGLQGKSHEEILSGYCQQLVDHKLPLLRLHVAQSAFHPHFGGLGFDWTHRDGVTSETFLHSTQSSDVWLTSPLYHMISNGLTEYREDLSDPDKASRFPLLNRLKAAGATDYFALALVFAGRKITDATDPSDVPEGVMVSWTSDRSGGFSAAELDLIRETLQPLALVLKSASNRRIARDLMQVYLGRDAGNRVLSGEILRGSLQTIDASICYFDLIGFTSFAERTTGTVIIEMLNAYFGLAVNVIEEAGGNVLKFMGDGLMAMFDVGDSQQDAKMALDMAKILTRKVEKMNAERDAEGLPTAGFTLALHNGEILYGNIGGENRLDFTVIGPAVNLAARISDFHKAVGQNILVSQGVRFAAGADRKDLVSVGRYMLRGASEPIELFTFYEENAVDKGVSILT